MSTKTITIIGVTLLAGAGVAYYLYNKKKKEKETLALAVPGTEPGTTGAGTQTSADAVVAGTPGAASVEPVDNSSPQRKYLKEWSVNMSQEAKDGIASMPEGDVQSLYGIIWTYFNTGKPTTSLAQAEWERIAKQYHIE